MEENREQPVIMPATALNPAESSAMSETGSQGDLGKFKNVQALMDAYENLQAEFTKKCQTLSQLQKEKTSESITEKGENIEQDKPANADPRTIEEPIDESLEDDKLEKFLECNIEASDYAEEIKERFSSLDTKSDPVAVAWADVILSHLKDGDKLSDPIINQYVLSDEKVRNRIVEDYLISLNNSKPPIIISSQSGERLSGVMPDSPRTLADAKKMVDEMFS